MRHVLCDAKCDSVKVDGNGPRTVGQQNADDIAIVQSVGAPFAALQWREEDSLNNFRCGHIVRRLLCSMLFCNCVHFELGKNACFHFVEIALVPCRIFVYVSCIMYHT